MTDLEVLVERIVGPAGRIDLALVADAMGAELDRLLASSSLRLPAEAVVDIDRLRVDGTAFSPDRLGDAGAIGVALAGAIVVGLGGGRHG
jgi:hypothetical protein